MSVVVYTQQAGQSSEILNKNKRDTTTWAEKFQIRSC